MAATTGPQQGIAETQPPPSPNGSAPPKPVPAPPVVPPMPSEVHPAKRHAATPGTGGYLRRITQRFTRH
ncbi:MAG: hypothetical protein ACLPUO_22755 [Streptosporangiaceae bacterium]|jgi:hypothetical protein